MKLFPQYFTQAKIFLHSKSALTLNSSTLKSVGGAINERRIWSLFEYIHSMKCQKFDLLANFSVLEGGCLQFDAVFHQVFQKHLLLLEKFCDIIA